MKFSFLFLFLLTTHFGFLSSAQLFNGPRDSVSTTYFVELASIENSLDFVHQFDRRPYSRLTNDTTLFRQFQLLPKADSTFIAAEHRNVEMNTLYQNRRDTLFNGNWQLESIDLFAFDNPCCFPSSSFHEKYIFSAENNTFGSFKLAEIFGKNWRYTTLGSEILVVSSGYFYIMNDSGEGNISCVFRLKATTVR